MSTAQLLRNVSHADYHADRLPGAPHLSQSVALKLITESPRRVYAAHPALGGAREEEEPEEEQKDDATRGTILHLMLFGEGPKLEVVDYPDWRKQAARDLRDAALAAGRVPVLARAFEDLQAAAVSLATLIVSLGIPVLEAERELTAVWEEEGVQCKGRFDLCLPRQGLIWDGKCTKLAPAAWRRAILGEGYDIQAYAYSQALAAVHPELAGRIRFSFLLLDARPPYDVAVIPAGESLLALGAMRWRQALAIWKRCLASGVWPGHGVLPPAEAPKWAMEDMLAAYAETNPEEPDWAKG